MKSKIRNLLSNVDPEILISPEQFAKWLFEIREQENLLYKDSLEDPKQYEYSENFIKELFWQIACLKFLQSLKMAITDENLNSIEKLTREYHYLDSIKVLMPSLTIDTEKLKLSAWETLNGTETLIESLDSFCEKTMDIKNFLYLVNHITGHDVRCKIRNFTICLGKDLINSKKDASQ